MKNQLLICLTFLSTLVVSKVPSTDCKTINDALKLQQKATSTKSAFKFDLNGNNYDLRYYYKESNYAGYYVKQNDDIIMAYEGSYKPTSLDEIEDTLPKETYLVNQNENEKYLNTVNFSTSNLICHPNFLFKSEIYSISAQRYISNCPEYFNNITGYENAACTAVTGAMLLNFYDIYSNYDVITGSLPLYHEDNKPAVDNFIKQLIDDMGVIPNKGTTIPKEADGLRKYIKRKNLPFKVNFGYSMDDYKNWILTSSNPVSVDLNGHTVLGVGFSEIRNNAGNGINTYLMVHFASQYYDHKGNYVLSDSYYKMQDFIYLTK